MQKPLAKIFLNCLHSPPVDGKQSTEAVPSRKVVPKPLLEKRLKEELLASVAEEGMVIVHCTYRSETEGGIRIWKSTFLVDRGSGERSPLHHAENISVAPTWTYVPGGRNFRFTLIFAPLPGSCSVFDLVEDIPEPGGFFIPDIKRNRQDVYHVEVL